MKQTYTTKQGDTWDIIAHNVFGSPQHTGQLMQANFSHLDVFVFDAGVVLQLPVIPEETAVAVPMWRAQA